MLFLVVFCAQAMSHAHLENSGSFREPAHRQVEIFFLMHTANAATANGEAVSLSAWRIASLKPCAAGHADCRRERAQHTLANCTPNTIHRHEK